MGKIKLDIKGLVHYSKKSRTVFSALGTSFLALLLLFFLFNFSAGAFMQFVKHILNNGSAEVTGYDYYVSPSGNDANSGVSSSLPFKTIQKAVDAAQSGQSIYLMPGSYLQDVVSRRDGTSSAPIKIAGPQEAVIKGGGNPRVIEINHDYITLTGFTIDGLYGSSSSKSGYRDMLIYAVGKESKNGVVGMRLLNMTLKNAGGECVRMKYFARNNEIAYNTITNCGVQDFKFNAGGKNGEGIYIGTAPEQLYKNPTSDLDGSNDNHIHNNVINTQGNEGVDIKEGSTGNIVEYNTISGQKDPESGGLDSRGDGNIFRFNEVSGSAGAGVRLGGDTYNGVQYGKNNDVYGNKIYDNSYGPVKVQALPQGKICGNTLSGNGSGLGDFGQKIDLTAPCDAATLASFTPDTGETSTTATTTTDTSGTTSATDTTATLAEKVSVCGASATIAKLSPTSVQASAYDSTNVPKNTLDGNLGTRWSAQGTGAWIAFDMGGVKTISYLKIAFYKGDQRAQKFDIEVSNNSQDWARMFSGQSAGNTSERQQFDFPDVAAKYLRIVGYGNNQNNWNSLTEVESYGIN